MFPAEAGLPRRTIGGCILAWARIRRSRRQSSAGHPVKSRPLTTWLPESSTMSGRRNESRRQYHATGKARGSLEALLQPFQPLSLPALDLLRPVGGPAFLRNPRELYPYVIGNCHQPHRRGSFVAYLYGQV